MNDWYKTAKELLRKKRISHDAVALRLGCTINTVGKTLNGTRQATIEEITVIADMLNMEVLDLLSGERLIAITPEEKDLIKAFRALKHPDKPLALKIIQLFKVRRAYS